MAEEAKDPNEIWDVIMIGAGPASLAAAVYTTREDIETLLFEKGAIGGLAAVTDWVDNYPGFPKGIAGLELADNLQKQAERFGAKIELGEVSKIEDKGDYKLLTTTEGPFKAKESTAGLAIAAVLVVSFCAGVTPAFFKESKRSVSLAFFISASFGLKK